jgi:endonuclease/exonuclease/phosphatase family metal-dependent hydrolase
MGNSLQDDHVFMDATTFAFLAECLVWDTQRVRELSDHGPVVVDLKLPL